MASPQCENGYTKIANELLEALLNHRIPGQEMRVILTIARMTYGFNKKSDQISYGQIAQMTDIPRRRVIEHVQSLVSKKALGSVNNGTRKPLTMWINKNYEEWEDSAKKDTSANGDTRGSAVIGPVPSVNNGTHQRKKEIRKKPTLVLLPEWLDPPLWKDFCDHRKKLRKPMTPRAEELVIKKLEYLQNQGHNPTHLIMTAIESGWQTVYEPKS